MLLVFKLLILIVNLSNIRFVTKKINIFVRTRFGSLAQMMYELRPKEPNTINL